MIIGIDFSIKSPAICVKYPDESLVFLTFPRQDVIKEDMELLLRQHGVIVNRLDKEKTLPKTANLTLRERSSHDDAHVEISSIMNELQKLDDEIESWAIEGFSFGSTGNRLAQISGYQWLLRHMISDNYVIGSEAMWVFAPMTVKATAGKGNFKKEDMITAFLTSEDPALRETGLWKALTAEPASFQNKKGAWMKPIDDIVDAYWVLRTLEKHMVETKN
jgi:hypothetical protein